MPYIYEDYADTGDAAKAIYDLYTMKKKERIKLGQKARQYALSEFSYQKTIDEWDKTMLKTIKDYKHSPRKTWEVKEITS